MPIKTIAVAVTSAREAEWLISAGLDLAASFDAHCTVVRPVESVVRYAGNITYESVIVPELMDWQVEETRAIRAAFDRVTSSSGVAAEFRAQDAGAAAEPFLLESVRAADLVMIGRLARSEGSPEGERLKKQLVRQCGRPVLVTPQASCPSGPVEHMLVGWSPTREATRAAHDSLTIAAPGAQIDLLTVGGHAGTDFAIDSRQDLAMALDRQGFRVELVDRDAPAGHAGEVLLRTAFERGAQLVATGAFGHSRVYDFVIGAVTSHLLEKAEIPVLLSK